jgi:phosphatidylglycerophosphate synthase
MPNALILPSASPFADLQIAGVPIIVRQACALGRAARTVFVLSTPATDPSLRARLQAAVDARAVRPRLAWVDSPAGVAPDGGLFVVARPGVFDQRLCAEMQAVPGSERKVIRCGHEDQDRGLLWFVGRERCSEFLGALAQSPEPGDPSRWFGEAPVEPFDPGQKICAVVEDEPSRRAAEEKLFAGARKDSDTWIAKNFDRHVSARISRLLTRLPLTPNHVTLMSFVLGVAGALLLALGIYATQLIGSALLVLSIIVDGCDGEVARLKFMESEFGRRLDFFLDNVVNALALFTMGFGYYVQGWGNFYLYASLINAGAAIASVLPVYFLFFRESKAAVDPDRVQSVDAFSVTENIAGRDYIYLIFLCALIGKLYWFVYATLAGILVFLPATLVLLAVKRLRGPEAPHRKT